MDPRRHDERWPAARARSMVRRGVWRVVVGGWMSLAGSVSAAGPASVDDDSHVLDEAAVIDRAAELALRRLDAATSVGESNRQHADRRTNPVVSWERQTVEGQGAQRQDMFALEMTLDVAKRRARTALVSAEVAVELAAVEHQRIAALVAAVHLYYDVVLARRRLDALDESLADLDEAARVLEQREQAGTVSGYERARLVVEVELVRSERAGVAAQRRAAHAMLIAALELDDVHIVDRLALVEGAAPSRRDIENNAHVAAVRRAEAATTLARARADRAWLPALSLQAGLNRNAVRNVMPGSDDSFSVGYGYVAGVALQLPFVDRGQVERAQAQASALRSRVEVEAVVRETNATVVAAERRYQSARAELERFDRASGPPVEVMLTAAQSGYREGVVELTALLDASRARTRVALRRIELFEAAKRAELDLRANTGALP